MGEVSGNEARLMRCPGGRGVVLYSRGARRPSWHHRGHVPARMNLEAGDEGGTVEALTG